MDTILVIDDDSNICWAFEQFLQDLNYNVLIASNSEDGLRLAAEHQPDLVLLDVQLPGMSGLEALQQFKSLHTKMQVVVMSAYDNIANTIQSMSLQAFDFLPKPIDLKQVKSILERISQLQQARRSISATSERINVKSSPQLVGQSQQMLEVWKMIGIMAANSMTVLIEGENGTGKGVVARAIHNNSSRRHNPFIIVDCGALPDSLLESELFGYEAGAFTGAQKKGKLGKFELANSGTLFLDEIGNMSSALQMRLLRTLQDSEIERLGGTRSVAINARVIAATNVNLEKSVKNGHFREDLYYRLKQVPIALPPLRKRSQDISLLAQHFLEQSSIELNRHFYGIENQCLALFQNYHWPGNVRELENAIKSAAVLSRSDVILPDHLPFEIRNFVSFNLDTENLRGTLFDETFELAVRKILDSPNTLSDQNNLYKTLTNSLDKELILALRQETNNNYSKMAKLLGISRTTLWQKIKTLQI
ncbi:hypothetical protein CMK18_18890 [Candidatus Poribacteria bacterium]|nr:hypothetical protein [Candidatus Poribacteria bacterium]